MIRLAEAQEWKTDTLRDELRWFAGTCKAEPRRSLRQFAEDEIVLPTGRWAGRKFRASRQPYVAQFMKLADDPRWNEIVCVGPSQSGKSLNMFVLPILYHLFECKETVIAGVVDLDEMGRNKWERDILPVVEKTRYRELMPRSGRGSRGAYAAEMTFENGATLKWMSGGGSDKTRAYFTSRVVCFTEIDELAKQQETSVESDKVKQIEARTRSYGRLRRIYKECTVTTPEGHIWSRYKAGTASRIMLPCEKCGEYVAPERDDLKGWQEAESDFQAEENSHFACPACKEAWTEEDRDRANRRAVIVHKGQEIENGGTIKGDMPRTRTLGFRWSGVNNLFLSSADFGSDMWKSHREFDQDNAERERSQFIWATPYNMPGITITKPDENKLKHRTRKDKSGWRKGYIPPNTDWVTVGIDVGKRLAYWTLVCFLDDKSIHIPEYGIFEVPSDQMGVELGLRTALRDFRDFVNQGWAVLGGDNEARTPDQIWVDANWQKEERGQADPIYDFLREKPTDPQVWKASLGRSRSQLKNRKYVHPADLTSRVRYIGEQYHIRASRTEGLFIVETNVDYWKTRVHERLMVDKGEPGHTTLFTSSDVNEHTKFSKHITAEEQVETNEIGKGLDIRWELVRRANHWFDSTVYAMAAGSFCGYSPRKENRQIQLQKR